MIIYDTDAATNSFRMEINGRQTPNGVSILFYSVQKHPIRQKYRHH